MAKWSLVVLIITAISSVGICVGSSLLVSPQGPIFVSPGSTLSINCTVVTADSSKVSSLTWHHQPLNSEVLDLDPVKFQQDWITLNTFVMTIKKIDLKDTGIYLCRSPRYGEQDVTVIVEKDVLSDLCAETHYRCPDGRCIFQRYRCDYVTDCDDGSDEKECDRSCEGMFRCASGQCINKNYVCDKFGSFDCRDGSDEMDCGRIKYGEEEEVVTEPVVKHRGHGMHFNAVYSGVASVIGVVCVGAIIVITIYRVHMRRESVRRSRLNNSPVVGSLSAPGHPFPSSARLPWRHRTPQTQGSSHATEVETLQSEQEVHVLPHRCRAQTNVTLKVTLQVSPEGIPLFADSVVKPPPYSEFGPPPIDECPPPPYTTLPYSETWTEPQDSNT